MSLKEALKDAYLNPKDGEIFIVSHAIFTTRDQKPRASTSATVCHTYDEALKELHRFICADVTVTYYEPLASLFAGKSVEMTVEQFILDKEQVRAVETIDEDGDICRVDIILQ